MVPAIIFAHIWGVLELTALGSFRRTLRIHTFLLAIATGLYLCEPMAMLLQYSWITLFAKLTGSSAHEVLGVGGYTVDPFMEELIKVLPVVLLLLIPTIRRQCSITDCILIAAATGAGFGLAEELFRYSGEVYHVNITDSGWNITGPGSPFVPGLRCMCCWAARESM